MKKFSLLLLVATLALTGRADETDPVDEANKAVVSDLPATAGVSPAAPTTQPVAKPELKATTKAKNLPVSKHNSVTQTIFHLADYGTPQSG